MSDLDMQTNAINEVVSATLHTKFSLSSLFLYLGLLDPCCTLVGPLSYKMNLLKQFS